MILDWTPNGVKNIKKGWLNQGGWTATFIRNRVEIRAKPGNEHIYLVVWDKDLVKHWGSSKVARWAKFKENRLIEVKIPRCFLNPKDLIDLRKAIDEANQKLDDERDWLFGRLKRRHAAP